MMTMTPSGLNSSQPDFAFMARLWCGTFSGRSHFAARWKRKSAVSRARRTSAKIASTRGLPVSREMTSAILSRFLKRASRRLRSAAARDAAGWPDQVFCAARADSKIFWSCEICVAVKVALISLVAGFRESMISGLICGGRTDWDGGGMPVVIVAEMGWGEIFGWKGESKDLTQ